MFSPVNMRDSGVYGGLMRGRRGYLEVLRTNLKNIRRRLGKLSNGEFVNILRIWSNMTKMGTILITNGENMPKNFVYAEKKCPCQS